jgi:hypothetical protein
VDKNIKRFFETAGVKVPENYSNERYYITKIGYSGEIDRLGSKKSLDDAKKAVEAILTVYMNLDNDIDEGEPELQSNVSDHYRWGPLTNKKNSEVIWTIYGAHDFSEFPEYVITKGKTYSSNAFRDEDWEPEPLDLSKYKR